MKRQLVSSLAVFALVMADGIISATRLKTQVGTQGLSDSNNNPAKLVIARRKPTTAVSPIKKPVNGLDTTQVRALKQGWLTADGNASLMPRKRR